MENGSAKSAKPSGPPTRRAFSEVALQKAVVKRSLQHPLTLFPLAGGILGGFWLWLIQPTIPVILATVAAFALGAANPVFHYFFKWHRHAGAHMANLTRRIVAHQARARTRINDILQECESLEGVENYAAKGRKQFAEVSRKFNLLGEILAKKLEPGELTHARFLGAAEQVYLNTLDNLKDLVNYIKGIAAIGSDYEGDMARLKTTQSLTRSQRKQLKTLLERHGLKKRQKLKVDELLALNEEALTEIDKTIAAFSETRIKKGQADMDINSAITEMEELAGRVKEYSLVKR